MSGERRRLLRAFLFLLVGLGVVGPISAGQADARQRSEVPPDLAAMALRPEDLAKEGLEGYGADKGGLGYGEDGVRLMAFLEGVDPAEAEEVLLDDAGFIGTYWIRLALPPEEAEGRDPPTRGVWCEVYLFDDADGGEVGYDFLIENYYGKDDESRERSRVGDGGLERYYRFEEAGDEVEAQELVFQHEAAIGVITVWDALRDGEDLDEPELEEVEALAGQLIDRIDAAQDGEAPNLSAMQLRFAGDAATSGTIADVYQAIDGTPIATLGEDEKDTAATEAWLESIALIDVYHIEQYLRPDEDMEPDDLYFQGTLYRFAGEAAAEAFHEEALEVIESNPSLGVDAIEPIDGADDLGDSSVAAAYTGSLYGAEFEGYVVVVLLGDIVTRVELTSADGVDLETVVEVAEAQIACIEDGACGELYPVPAELR